MEHLEALVTDLKDLVNRLVEEGDFAGALAQLDAAGPVFGYLRFKRAVCAVRLGKWADALHEARTAGEEDPTLREECAWIAAEALRRLGRHAEAEAAYLGLAAEAADAERRRAAKGLAALAREERDDWRGAALLYREILAADPDDEEASFRLALALERGGHLPEAEEAWTAFLRDHGGGTEAPKARFRLAMVLYRRGRYADAASQFERAAEEAKGSFLESLARRMADRAAARGAQMRKGARAYDPRS